MSDLCIDKNSTDEPYSVGNWATKLSSSTGARPYFIVDSATVTITVNNINKSYYEIADSGSMPLNQEICKFRKNYQTD
uniref:Uncharacterized protein n=1 Tax=Romanomermis culicivorax TaxID=13658 RepID=A0A915JYQ3_ROMCU